MREGHESDERDAPPARVLMGRPGLEAVARRAAALHRAWMGRQPVVLSAAPGRVNLIGEHVDYAGGVMLPCAIDRWCVAAVSPGERGVLRVRSEAMGVQGESDAEVVIPCHRLASYRGDPMMARREFPAWARYVVGVACGMLHGGEKRDGIDLSITSSVPLGAGLASSAALCVAVAGALDRGEQDLGGEVIAAVARTAERVFVGVPCGVMDQAASALAQSGCALLIDAIDESVSDAGVEPVPWSAPGSSGGGLGIVVINSGVKHALPDGGFAALVDACRRASAALEVLALGMTSPEFVDAHAARLRDDELRAARHVTREVARTRAFVRALCPWPDDPPRSATDRATALGHLLAESHASLRDLCRVSCPEIETIVAAATGTPGVFGARLTGAGFGGSVVALVDGARAESIRQALESRVAAAMGRACDTMLVTPVAGWVSWKWGQ